MNFLSEFYTLWAAHMLNIVDANDKPIIKELNFWNNQYEFYEDTFGLPAVFIEFKSIPFQTVGKHIQKADMSFDLHIGSKVIGKGSYGNQFMNQFLAHLELIDSVNYWMTGFRGDFFSSISRTGFTADQYYATVIDHIVSYRCIIKDDSATRNYTKVLGDKLVIELSSGG